MERKRDMISFTATGLNERTKQRKEMATNSSFMFKWLICCALVINVGLISAREDDESREGNITSMSSPSQSPTLPDAPYICELRVKIFGYKCEEHEVHFPILPFPRICK